MAVARVHIAGVCSFFFQAEDGIRDLTVTGVQTCALPISDRRPRVCRCSLANGMPSSARGWPEWGMTERMPQSGLPLVLLAGDGKEATRWLRVLLEGGGYAVLQERTGQHGLERAGTTEPDVILVDAELPDMAGIELCRMLRADPRVSSSTPILLTIRDAATREQR